MALVLAFCAPLQATPRRFDAAFAALIKREMTTWGVPGLAVAVVSRDTLLYARGFGVTHLHTRRPVTTGTLFAIGSLTKAFTATLVAMLVAEKRLAWNRPVRDYLPEFRLKDPIADRRITPRDLLIHNSGLPRHDLLWYGGFGRKELVRRMRFLDPSARFREKFQYSNLIYTVAGYLVGRVTKSSWETQLKARILRPLGMTRTTVSAQGLRRSRNWARPHRIDGYSRPRVTPVPYRDVDAIAPSGSLASTVEELGRWLQFFLNRGRVGRRRVLAPGIVDRLLAPQIVSPNEFTGVQRDRRFAGQLQCCHYALGWDVATYRGTRLLTHGGGADGYRARIMLLPDRGYGVVVLTNGERGSVAMVAAMAAVDRLLGKSPLPFAAYYDRALRRLERRQRYLARHAVDRLKPKASRPPRQPLSAYVGRFVHPAYGELTVIQQAGKLQLRFRRFTLRLVHLTDDRFAVTGPYAWLRYSPSLLQFMSGPRGRISALTVIVDPAAKAATFRRR